MIKTGFAATATPSAFAVHRGQQIAIEVRLARRRFLASLATLEAERRYDPRPVRDIIHDIMYR